MTLVGVALCAAAYGTGHADWVDAGLLVAFVAGVLVPPLLVVVHELAHAAAVVALTGQRVMVRIGGEPYLVRFALGKIDVRFHPSGYVAHCEFTRFRMSPRRLLVVSLAGPAASIALAAALALLSLVWQATPVLFWIGALSAAGSLFIGISNAVPFRRLPSWWPGALKSDEEGPSDGFWAWEALKARRGGGDATGVGVAGSRRHAKRHVVTERVDGVIRGRPG